MNSALEPGRLDTFFEGLGPAFFVAADSVADNLAALFKELAGLNWGDAGTAPATVSAAPSASALSALFEAYQAPSQALALSGVLSDPWAAAGLRRDEVRNASTLSWFLDPRGHPNGRALLDALLRLVGKRVTDIPEQAAWSCTVSVETCPDGDRRSRVDIQIDDPRFFIIIEVKTDAGEQPEQVARYCELASKLTSGARPFAIIFLTVDGREPSTAGHWADRVLPVSWQHLANVMRSVARQAQPIPQFLATSYASHISGF